MWSRLVTLICHFFWLLTRNQDFFDKKCGILTFRDKKCRILTFHDKKCCIPAFRDKTLLNTVLPCYCNSLVSRSLSLSNALWAVSKGPRALWAISLSRVRPELRDWLTRPLLGSERRSCVPAPYATLYSTSTCTTPILVLFIVLHLYVPVLHTVPHSYCAIYCTSTCPHLYLYHNIHVPFTVPHICLYF